MTENRPSAPAPGVYTPPQERSTHGRSPGAGEEHARSKEHEWRQRLESAMAGYARKRTAKNKLRAELAERRAYGLMTRHAAKLRRTSAGDTKENEK